MAAAVQLRGPKRRFVSGNLPEFRRNRLGFLMNCARRHDDFVPLRLGATRALFVNNPDAIEEVLGNSGRFSKSFAYRISGRSGVQMRLRDDLRVSLNGRSPTLGNAVMEAGIILSMLLPRFQFQPVPDHEVVAWPGFTLRPRSGVHLVTSKAPALNYSPYHGGRAGPGQHPGGRRAHAAGAASSNHRQCSPYHPGQGRDP